MAAAANDPPDRPPSSRVLLVAESRAGLGALRPTGETLDAFGVTWSEAVVTPDDSTLVNGARAVIVASADGRLPGKLTAQTGLPVVRVPVAEDERAGLDLLQDDATGNLPAAPSPEHAFATVAIGEAGAKNAALLVVSILGLKDAALWERWLAFRRRQTDAVPEHPPDTA